MEHMKRFQYITIFLAMMNFLLYSTLSYYVASDIAIEISEKNEKEEKADFKENLKILSEYIIPQLFVANQSTPVTSKASLSITSDMPLRLHFQEVPTPPPNV